MTGPFNRIIEAVASIAQKLGATVTDSGNRLADNLEGIAEVASGGSGLPSVTAEDNGDVLTVVSGEWAKATPSGGGGVLVVGATAETQDEEMTITLDKTWQEIVDADFAVIKLEVPQIEGDGSTLMIGQATVAWPPVAVGDGYIIMGAFMVQSGASGEVMIYRFVADTANDYPVFSSGTK